MIRKNQGANKALVQKQILIEQWMAEELKKRNINASDEIRKYLYEKFSSGDKLENRRKELEDELESIHASFEELKAKKLTLDRELESIHTSFKNLEMREKEIENDIESITILKSEKYIDENLDAWILKTCLLDGTIPQDFGIFQFPDRDLFIADMNSGKIKATDPLEAFKIYRFKVVPTQKYKDIRDRKSYEFRNWLKFSVPEMEKKAGSDSVE